MEFRDLHRQYEALKPAIDQAVLSTVAEGRYIMGPAVRELEKQLSAYVGVAHCLTCANGTDALTLALKAWGIGPGDAVFVPDFTFFSSAEVVSLEGATPVFVDVDPSTYNIDPDRLEQAIEAVMAEGRLAPKVIVAVDLFGLPANYPALRAIADRYHLWILEDGAQGFGGAIQGQRACCFGDISTTSFFPAKPLGCYGDGGAVFTDNDQWAALIASYRVHGKGTDKYDNVRVGMNSRLDTLQAAVLQVKLRAFQEQEWMRVNAVAASYTAQLQAYVRTPFVPDGYSSSWAQYTIQLPDRAVRDSLQRRLKEADIPSMVCCPKPMHAQSVFSGPQGAVAMDCPCASVLPDRVLSLPMHPYLTEEEVMRVCEIIIQELDQTKS